MAAHLSSQPDETDCVAPELLRPETEVLGLDADGSGARAVDESAAAGAGRELLGCTYELESTTISSSAHVQDGR